VQKLKMHGQYIHTSVHVYAGAGTGADVCTSCTYISNFCTCIIESMIQSLIHHAIIVKSNRQTFILGRSNNFGKQIC
jgi:DTW domain-containing protein YfiP